MTNDNEYEFDKQDDLLATIVRLINMFGGDMTITISVNGTILSGQIISGKEYFKLLSITTATANTTDDSAKSFRDSLAAALTKGTKLYPQMDGTNTEAIDEAYASIKTGYLHLKNVYVVTGDIRSNNSITWRIRISEIDGWSLSGTIPRPD